MRLHRRFVTLFATAAVIPAVIVALFFGLLVTRGVESWFSSRVRTAVEDSARVARSYLRQQEDATRSSLTPIADDLNRAAPYFARSRLASGACCWRSSPAATCRPSTSSTGRAACWPAPSSRAPPPTSLRRRT